MDNACSVVLAAGDGKRMKSALPKVLCEVLFKPMISWVLDGVREAGIENTCLVVPDSAEELLALVESRHGELCVATAVQQERRGTGHAVLMASDYIQAGDFDDVLVLFGDAPFVSAQDIRQAYEAHRGYGHDVTVMTAVVDDPAGYGRIVRENGVFKAIVEHRDASDAERQIKEINSGAIWFRADFLLEALRHLTCDNAQNEYYLTDTVSYALKEGYSAGACAIGPDSALGANDRISLAALNAIARAHVLRAHMENGVNIPFPDGIVIGADVRVGADTTILPGTILRGQTRIGRGCEIGPNAYLDNAVLGDRCRVISSYIDSSELEDHVKIGPMSNVRPGSILRANVRVGDFVEIKNSDIGEGTSAAHLTYIGDSDVGRGCNFGCGVVTSNYDGTTKSRTVIGDDVFIGCNTNFIAPVRMGDRSYSAAGTTVTEDVPADSLVIGRSRQIIKEDWTIRSGKYRKS